MSAAQPVPVAPEAPFSTCSGCGRAFATADEWRARTRPLFDIQPDGTRTAAAQLRLCGCGTPTVPAPRN